MKLARTWRPLSASERECPLARLLHHITPRGLQAAGVELEPASQPQQAGRETLHGLQEPVLGAHFLERQLARAGLASLEGKLDNS